MALMPRPPRLHVAGGHYHVVLRGNHRETLFGAARDRRILNEIVADVAGRCNARVHAFCWMTNHLHFLLQISDLPLGRLAQRIAQRYSRYRHKQLRTSGHLFERRYHARLVDVDEYFLTVMRYIHLNPVKARLVSDPAAYEWSSHRAFLGRSCLPWVTTAFGLSMFAADVTEARVAYRRFILEPGSDEGEDNLPHSEDPRILGTEDFASSVPNALVAPLRAVTLDQLAAQTCAHYGTSVELLRSALRGGNLTAARAELARRAMTEGVASCAEVASFLGINPSSVSRALASARAARAQKQ